MEKLELGKRLKEIGDDFLKMRINSFVERYNVPEEELEDFLQMAKMAGRHELILEAQESLSKKF